MSELIAMKIQFNLNLYDTNISPRIASELLIVRNNPSATKWNSENGYRSEVNESELYPLRVTGSNLLKSLQIKGNIILDKSFMYCNFFTLSFLLSLHRPDELPDLLKDLTFVPPENAIEITIKPKKTVTSEGLHNYAPQVRGCYLRSERQLRFFNSYSQNKCELECVANYIKVKCGCVQFDMPSK